MGFPSDPVPPEILSQHLDDVPGHTLAPSEYWARLSPHLSDFGITRVADITGLDRIGFPVLQAVRPLARSNAVTQGKAATKEAAAIGAVLECVEMAAGEGLERCSSVPSAAPDMWTDLAADADWPASDTDFVAAWDLCQDCPAAVPRDVLSTDFARGALAERAPILRHSIGLGAGATPGAAMIHGLLECIEADARYRFEATGLGRRLRLDKTDKTYGPLLQRLVAAGFRVSVWDVSYRRGITCVTASVMEAPGASALPLPASGSASRTSASDAIQAALAEAVQARLAVISGAREDISQRIYRHGYAPVALDEEWERHAPGPLDAAPDTGQFHSTLRTLAQSVGRVFAVPLHLDPKLPLAVTRVLAPDLIADPQRLAPPA